MNATIDGPEVSPSEARRARLARIEREVELIASYLPPDAEAPSRQALYRIAALAKFASGA